MGEISRELYLRHPAQVVQRQEIMEAPAHARYALINQVGRLEQRGQVRRLSRAPLWNEALGVWEMPVRRLTVAQPSPWPRRLTWIAIALVMLAVLLALGWWLLTSLAAVPLAGFCLAVLAGLLLVVRAGRPRVTVTTTVRTEIR